MRVAPTGAVGFLRWHTQARMVALIKPDVIPVDAANGQHPTDLVGSACAVISLGGINRRHEQRSGIRQLP